MMWKDQGHGYSKGQVGLFTAFADGTAIYTSPFAPRPGLTPFSDTIQLPAGMRDLEFKYKLGHGGGHTITIKDFAWSWSPQSPPSLPPPSPSPQSPSHLGAARTAN